MITSTDPTYGASTDTIKTATGASDRTARRWKANPDTIPPCASRLIRFAVWGDCEELFGEPWKGFYFQSGKLHAPCHKRGFLPNQIAGMFFELQELRWMRGELLKLNAEVKTNADRRWSTAKLEAITRNTHEPHPQD